MKGNIVSYFWEPFVCRWERLTRIRLKHKQWRHLGATESKFFCSRIDAVVGMPNMFKVAVVILSLQPFLTVTSFFYLTNNETRYLRAFSKTLRKFEKNNVSLLWFLYRVSFNTSINFFGEMVLSRSEPNPVRGPLLLENLSKSSSDLQTDRVEVSRSKCFMH